MLTITLYLEEILDSAKYSVSIKFVAKETDSVLCFDVF